MKADLVIKNASEILTLSGEAPKIKKNMQNLGIIHDGWVAIKNKRIVSVGDSKDMQRWDAKKVVDASDKVVLPGFVDPHTHLVFAGSREFEMEWRIQGMDYLEIARHGGGIGYTMGLTRRASKDRLMIEAKKKLDSMLSYGTTTIEAKSGYGLSLRDEIKILDVMKTLSKGPVDIVPTFMGAHSLPPEFEDYNAYTEYVVKAMIPEVAKQKLARYCDVFCDKGFFTVEQTHRILNAARKYGMGTRIHADEIERIGGAELAAETGCASADHLLKTDENGIKAMASKGTVGILLPAAAMVLRSRYADARKMIDMGIPVALGTDLNPNCWVENMQLVIALACHQMGMTQAEAITAATINAAHSIGLSNEIGSIERGKRADIIILDIPNHKHLGYRFGGNLVETVIKNGKVMMER